jgi:hypothetical protein
LPDVLTVIAALVVWRIFFPALMSADSIAQYEQARAGIYNNWHPPLMAFVLHLTFSAGGDIGGLMLIQCLTGAFGVRALAAEVIRALWPARFTERAIAWIGLVVLATLLLPWSPLVFYLMTFWKDAWVAVGMLWLGTVILALGRTRDSRWMIVAALALGVWVALLRHNAIVLLPLVGAATWFAVVPAGRWRGPALLAAPLVAYLLAAAALDRGLAVTKLHVDSQVMVLDLVGICTEYPADCSQLPWTASHIRDRRALAEGPPADFGVVFLRQPPAVDPAIRADYERLRSEYLFAARNFPLHLATLKGEIFSRLLGLESTYYFFHGGIVDNAFHLALNQRFAGPRDWLEREASRAAENRLWRWLSGVHFLWIAVDLAWILALIVQGRRTRRRELILLAVVLTIPLGYYMSYLVGAPVPDFRFMYPSTLFVQCVTLASLFAVAQEPTGRRPSFSRLSS